MKHSILSTVVAGGLALGATSAMAETWNLATGFADGNFQSQNVHFFAQEVERLTDGALAITVHTGQSLYAQPEIKGAVSSGQIQAGEILLSAYGNENPLFEVDSIPFLARGYDEAHALYMAQKPLLEEEFETSGLKLLYSVAWPCTAIYSQDRIESLDDLAGVKFRAYNAATSRLAERLGATPTTVQAVEVPQAFSTGVISAMITSPITGKDTQSWDYISYYTDTCAWHNKNFVIVNAAAFAGLDEAVQQQVLEAAAAAEKRGWEKSREAGDAAVEVIASHGVEIVEPSEELNAEFKAIGDAMLKEWLEDAGETGSKLISNYSN